MKSCPFCAEEIQDAAVKCKHCGEFLEATSGPTMDMSSAGSKRERKAQPPAKQEIPQDLSELFCGFCHNSNVPFKPVADGKAECPRCSHEVVYSIRRTRSKKSRQQSKNRVVASRDISIRVHKPDGDEELLEFKTEGDDLEAKSGDWLAFIGHRSGRCAIVNMTLGQKLVLARPILVEMKLLEAQIAKLKPTPPPSPASQGCCFGCLLWLLSSFCFVSGSDAGIMVGFGVFALGALAPGIAQKTVKEPEPSADYLAAMGKIESLDKELVRLKNLAKF